MIHVVLSRTIDFAKLAADVAANQAPTHVLLELARQVPVAFHMPNTAPFQLFFDGGTLGGAAGARSFPLGYAVPAVTNTDILRGKLISRPELWALARHAVAQASPQDSFFATGEDVGIPLAAACAARDGAAPRLVVTVHNINRPRARMAFRLFKTTANVSTWVTPAASQAAYLRSLNIPEARIYILPEQTDTRFFTPAPIVPIASRSTRSPGPDESQAATPARPLIVSVGLEQRDYRTLAAATADKELDVRISGFSSDASAMADAFPPTLPRNMTRQFYEWPALRELYRAADMIVVPLFPNQYVAGVNCFMEALACEKPVIISQTEGMAGYVEPPGASADICLPIPPSNPARLSDAIDQLLRSPAAGRTLAENGRRWLLAHHTPRHWVDAVIKLMNVAPAI